MSRPEPQLEVPLGERFGRANSAPLAPTLASHSIMSTASRTSSRIHLPATGKEFGPSGWVRSAIAPTTLLSRFPPENFVKINKDFALLFYKRSAIRGTSQGRNWEERGPPARWQALPARTNWGRALAARPGHLQSENLPSRLMQADSATSKPKPYRCSPVGWYVCWPAIPPFRSAWRGGRPWLKPRGRG